jgi:hypothetical protein
MDWYNNAHIAYNSGRIADVSGIILPVLKQELSKPDLSPDNRQKFVGALNKLEGVNDDAKKLEVKSEKSTTADDVSDEVGDYVSAATSSQIICAEIKEIGEELNGGGDVQKVSEITKSIEKKAKGLEKPVGGTQGYASKFKKAVLKFKQTLEEKFKSVTEKIGDLKNTFAELLKIAADLLQEFFSRLVSSFFGFASWIQKIALRNKFSINELSLELPSFEFSILMVGPYPLPVPKLTTPKLTATFVPVPAPPKKS